MFDQTLRYIDNESIGTPVYQAFVDKYPDWRSPGQENVHIFLGALIPGVLLGLLYIAYLALVGIVKPSLAPATEREPIDFAATWGLVKAIVPAAFLILAVLGSIFFGLATPTEAAGVGAAGALLLAFAKGAISLRVMREVIDETSRTSAFIFGGILGAVCFNLVLRGLGGDEVIERALLALPFGPDGIVICILIATFLLGFFLDWRELTLILLPLVAPVEAQVSALIVGACGDGYDAAGTQANRIFHENRSLVV